MPPPPPNPPPKLGSSKGHFGTRWSFSAQRTELEGIPCTNPTTCSSISRVWGRTDPPRGAHRQHPATPYRCSDPNDKHEGQWEGGFTLHIALSPLPGLPSWCGWGHGGVQGRDCPPPSLSFLEVPAFLIKQRLPLLRKGPQNPALPHGRRGKGHGDPPKALRDPIPTRSPRPGGCRGGSPVPGAAHVGAQSGTGRKRRSGSGEEQWKERAPGAADSKLPLRERGKEKESSSRRGAARVLPPAAWGGPVCLPAPWGGGVSAQGAEPHTLSP